MTSAQLSFAVGFGAFASNALMLALLVGQGLTAAASRPPQPPRAAAGEEPPAVWPSWLKGLVFAAIASSKTIFLLLAAYLVIVRWRLPGAYFIGGAAVALFCGVGLLICLWQRSGGYKENRQRRPRGEG